MNYYELKKLATPGPWHVEGPMRGQADEYDVLVLCANKTWLGELNESQWDIADIRNKTQATERARANAQIIAHCVNNFDQALSVLRKCRTCLEMAGIAPSPELVQTIKEMENE